MSYSLKSAYEQGWDGTYEWYGCPLTVNTDESVEKVRATVRTDCHLDINMITE